MSAADSESRRRPEDDPADRSAYRGRLLVRFGRSPRAERVGGGVPLPDQAGSAEHPLTTTHGRRQSYLHRRREGRNMAFQQAISVACNARESQGLRTKAPHLLLSKHIR